MVQELYQLHLWSSSQGKHTQTHVHRHAHTVIDTYTQACAHMVTHSHILTCWSQNQGSSNILPRRTSSWCVLRNGHPFKFAGTILVTLTVNKSVPFSLIPRTLGPHDLLRKASVCWKVSSSFLQAVRCSPVLWVSVGSTNQLLRTKFFMRWGLRWAMVCLVLW